jgi:hypothetical protein
MLVELSEPFHDFFKESYISDQANLARNYPLGKKEGGWQEDNITSASCLDAVDQQLHSSNDDDADEEFEKEMFASFTEESSGHRFHMALALSSTAGKDWEDVNDAFHDKLVRDDVNLNVNHALDDDDDLEKELFVSFAGKTDTLEVFFSLF